MDYLRATHHRETNSERNREQEQEGTRWFVPFFGGALLFSICMGPRQSNRDWLLGPGTVSVLQT